jgi:UMF1 family MFS transporter
MSESPPVRRREIFGWAMFDFANSSYTTVILTVAFGVFFSKLVAPEGKGDALWGTALAVSNLIVMVASTIVGAVADGAAKKKAFLFVTYLGCVGATASLSLVGPGQVTLALILVILSNIAFSLGENLTASFLPELSTPRNIGKISGLGWGLGYIGGILSVFAIKPLLAGGFVVENLANLRQAWMVTAAFFLVAGAITFVLVRERAEPTPGVSWLGHAREGFGRIRATLAEIRHFRELTRFLTAFFCYQAGLSSVFVFAGLYAEKTLEFTSSELVWLFIVLNLSGALGAIGFGFVQDALGALRTVRWTLLFWVVVTVGAFLCQTKGQFWIVGTCAGLGMGSLQSASRALVGLFSPVKKTAEFFGFWGLAGKGAYVVGLPVFGWLSTLTGNQRIAILSTAGFFLLGFLLIGRVNEAAGRQAAAEWDERP